jgi:ketosteroid isomerase-like protein
LADADRQSRRAPSAADSPLTVVESLRDATNAHDVDGIVACFAADYRNETPAHPARSFVGPDQVRRNWDQILQAVPDLTAEILGYAEAGDTVWSEWRQEGTRADGSRHRMAGVIVFGVSDGLIQSARFFLEPVENDGDVVGDAIRRQVTARGSA